MGTTLASVNPAALAQLRARATPDQPDFFQEMVRLFLADNDKWLATLLQARARADLALLARAAHAIGGGALIFGASKLDTLCRTLKDVKSPDSEETHALVDGIRDECAEVRRILEGELQSPSQ